MPLFIHALYLSISCGTVAKMRLEEENNVGLFSERMGYKPAKTAIQVESMDNELRNRLWNALFICYFDNLYEPGVVRAPFGEELSFFRILWNNYFK